MDYPTSPPTNSQPGTVLGKPLNPDALQSVLGKRPVDLAAASSDPKRSKPTEDGAAGPDAEMDKAGDDTMSVDPPAAVSTPHAKDTEMAVDAAGTNLQPLSFYKDNDGGPRVKIGTASGKMSHLPHSDLSPFPRTFPLPPKGTHLCSLP